MRARRIIVAAFLALVCVGSLPAQSLREQVREQVRNRLETAGLPPEIVVAQERIHASVVLPRFYEARTYAPAWSDDAGPRPIVGSLLAAVRRADEEGLRPADYHLAAIEDTLAIVRKNIQEGRAPNPVRLADLDLLLTDAFLVYAAHLHVGRVDPETIHSLWLANRREANLDRVLTQALESGRIEESLRALLPPQAGYAGLRGTLARYRDIAARGGWPALPEGSKLQKGDTDPRLVTLRARLRATGDFTRPPSAQDVFFDDVLEEALKNFQQRHGLTADGILGPGTVAALNVPVEQRLHQIELNLERWRWLPQDLGQRHILVNIANFELEVVEAHKTVMTMRAIVGRTYRRTPVFSDRMSYLVFSPFWHVPRLIAVQDLLPNIKKDPGYVTSMGFKIFEGWGADTKAIDPKSVDWSQMTPKNFPYHLRQDPGPKNFLGGVKFMFPNKFNVYLHGTPQPELFAKEARDFSSGCIRLEKPLELAEYVLHGDPRWTREAMLAAIEKRIEQTVRLPEPIPVHLLYWTAWADSDGRVHFRRDLYERDNQLDAALHTSPPGPATR